MDFKTAAPTTNCTYIYIYILWDLALGGTRVVGRGRQGGGPAWGIWDSYLFPGKATYCQASKDSQASTQAFHRHAPKPVYLPPTVSSYMQ